MAGGHDRVKSQDNGLQVPQGAQPLPPRPWLEAAPPWMSDNERRAWTGIFTSLETSNGCKMSPVLSEQQ